MGQRTIYVREEHEVLWEQAKALVGDDSISAMIAEGLREVIARRTYEAQFTRIKSAYWLNGEVYVPKVFRGHAILGRPDAHGDFSPSSWHVAVTRRRKYVIWQEGGRGAAGQWYLTDTLDEAPPSVPRAVLEDVSVELAKDTHWLPELDI
jgi:hypothetical protein